MDWLRLLNWILVILGWCLVPVWVAVVLVCLIPGAILVGCLKLIEPFQQLREGLED